MRSPAVAFLLAALVALSTGLFAPTAMAAPAVTTIVPSSGTENGGTVLTISGSGFAPGAQVCLDNLVSGSCPTVSGVSRAATQVIVNSAGTEIKAKTPARSVGSGGLAVAVVIKNLDGQTTTVSGGYTYNDASAPTIASLSPNSGSTNGGNLITIKGTNFDPNALRPTVCFGELASGACPAGTLAPVVTVVDSTTLKAVTPAKALPAGAVDVNVLYTAGTASKDSSFLYEQAAEPIVTGTTPSSGGTNGGNTVTVNGNNFAQGAIVQFGGVAGTRPVVNGPTSISVVVPPHAPPAVGVTVLVRNPDGQEDFIGSGYTYSLADPPTATSVTPNAGPVQGGEVLTLAGTDFQSGTIVCASEPLPTCPILDRVEMVGTPTATSLAFAAPPHAAGAFNGFWVLNPDSQKDNLPTFTYRDTFAISGVSPTTGSANGGIGVTLSGGPFACGATPELMAMVLFGGVPSPEVTAAASCSGGFTSSIVANLPGHAAGAVDIVVNNPTGLAGVFQNGFTYNQADAPTITGVAPSSGTANGGTTVTITGTKFACGGGEVELRVLFGDAEATSVTVPGTGGTCTAGLTTKVDAVTPPRIASQVTLAVINPSGRADSATFTYTTAAPDFAAAGAVSPTSGTSNGGTVVALTGTNTATTGFACGADPEDMPEVLFGGIPSPTVTAGVACVAGETTVLHAVAPGHTPGAVEVRVINPSKEADSISNGYTYTAAADPTLAAAPLTGATSGTSRGGTSVAISGTNFACTGVPPTVLFGGTEGTDVAVGSCSGGANSVGTTLTVVTPPHASGKADVVVRNPDPSSPAATAPEAFTFTSSGAPVVSSLTPRLGSGLGGTRVALAGSDFFCLVDGPKPIVTFDTIPVDPDDITLGSCSASRSTGTLTVVTPPHAAGNVLVKVRNPDGLEGQQANAFRYMAALPTLASLSPTSGADSGGPLTTLTGSNFVAGATVLFGKAPAAFAPATSVVVSSATQASVKTPEGTGLVDVIYVDPDGQSVAIRDAYTFTEAAAPVATAIVPNVGSVVGGTSVTISGAQFLAGSQVCFGPLVSGACPADARATSVTTTSATTITAVTPPHAIGSVDVTVIGPDGQASSPLTQEFTYLGTDQLPVPSITSVTPAAGPGTGGTTVTIVGTNFVVGATTVSFGGAAATDVTVSSATQLTAKTPVHAAGLVDVIVTAGGQSFTKTGAFNYTSSGTPSPTPTPTGTGSPNPTTGPTSGNGGTGAPTAAVIEAANKRIEITVERQGDSNVIEWVLPAASTLPLPVQGVQLWAGNSPYALVDTFPANSDEFQARSFTHAAGGDPPAEAGTKYLVTMFYGATAALGFFSGSQAPDTEDYPGFASTDEVDDGGAGGLPTWAIVLIVLGILFLVVLVAILIARGRSREQSQQVVPPEGYAWEEEQAKRADAEWGTEGGTTAEVHQARCPACGTSFPATGAKPIVTACPGCGKKGILR